VLLTETARISQLEPGLRDAVFCLYESYPRTVSHAGWQRDVLDRMRVPLKVNAVTSGGTLDARDSYDYRRTRGAIPVNACGAFPAFMRTRHSGSAVPITEKADDGTPPPQVARGRAGAASPRRPWFGSSTCIEQTRIRVRSRPEIAATPSSGSPPP
jgi:hypothetical protein